MRSIPGWPGLARRGARFVEVVKWALPKPPLPPRATTTRSTGLRQVGEHRAGFVVEDLGADRRLQDGVGAAPAGAVPAHAVHAGLGLEMLLVAEVDQRVEAVGAFDHDVAAPAAVAAVRAAELDEFLAPERDAARPAVAGAHIDARLVEKFHGVWPCHGARASADGRRDASGGRPVQSARVRRKLWHSTMPPRAGAPCRPVPIDCESALPKHR